MNDKNYQSHVTGKTKIQWAGWSKSGFKNGLQLSKMQNLGNLKGKFKSNLLLRDDYLGWKSVFGVWHRVVEETNATNNLTDFTDPIGSIGGVAVDLTKIRKLFLWDKARWGRGREGPYSFKTFDVQWVSNIRISQVFGELHSVWFSAVLWSQLTEIRTLLP